MTREQYEQFQKVQGVLYALVEEIVPIETVRGNELFQLLSDVVFEFYSSGEKKESPA